MNNLVYDDDWLKDILCNVRVVVMIGASAKNNRPSYNVMKYLQGKGYRVIPVNPGLAGGEILGETVYASLKDVPGPYQMVDIFRNSEAAGVVSDEVVSLKEEKQISVIWMQLGVRNDPAGERAEAAGIKVVMDRCPKIEHGRLF